MKIGIGPCCPPPKKGCCTFTRFRDYSRLLRPYGFLLLIARVRRRQPPQDMKQIQILVDSFGSLIDDRFPCSDGIYLHVPIALAGKQTRYSTSPLIERSRNTNPTPISALIEFQPRSLLSERMWSPVLQYSSCKVQTLRKMIHQRLLASYHNLLLLSIYGANAEKGPLKGAKFNFKFGSFPWI